jgi:hypothetical protein
MQSATERYKAFADRQKTKGLVLKQVWVKPIFWEIIKRMIKKINGANRVIASDGDTKFTLN